MMMRREIPPDFATLDLSDWDHRSLYTGICASLPYQEYGHAMQVLFDKILNKAIDGAILEIESQRKNAADVEELKSEGPK